ncbi:MAG: S24 family peptidase [Gemmatimonadota bacterium]
MPRSEPTEQREVATPTGRPLSDTGAEALTEIERKILDFMVQYLRANTYQPSIREIGERFGIKSTKTVSEHLQALADKGWLERDPSRSRGVKILGVDLSAQAVSLPCFSEMPQGPGAAPELHLSIDRRLAGEGNGFFVRAGSSDLAVLGVHEGDYVLVEPAELDDLEDGAVVAADVGKGTWFHRFLRNGTGVHLESLRPGGGSVAVPDSTRLRLLGRVTAFYRRMDESAAGLNLTQH